jgi:hypothetical protein
MSDGRLRNLERRLAQGDAGAKRALIEGRSRAGLCPWCAGPGAIHRFDHNDGSTSDVNCCCGSCFKEYSCHGVCGECPHLLREATGG